MAGEAYFYSGYMHYYDNTLYIFHKKLETLICFSGIKLQKRKVFNSY